MNKIHHVRYAHTLYSEDKNVKEMNMVSDPRCRKAYYV